MKKIATNYNFLLNEIKEARIWTVATDPTATSAHKGAILYNETDDVMKFCTGTKWVVLGTLDQMSAEADVSLSGFNLTDIGAPLLATDAASKGYVDNLLNGLSWKGSVVVTTTEDIALSGTLVIDGVQTVAGDRVLVKDQTDATENGIYVVDSGAWSRSSDTDSNGDLQQATVVVQEGTAHSDTTWTCTSDDVVLDTSDITFTQTSGTNTYNWGTGLEASGNTINLFGQALAIHQLSANGLVVRDASGSFVSREVVGSTNTGTLVGAQVTNGSGVAGNVEIGIAVSDSGVGGNGVSNSLAREDHFHVAHTLQEVTDQGNTTTNMIDITGGSALNAGAPPTALRLANGHMMQVGGGDDGTGQFWLTNDANPGLPNGGAYLSIVGNGVAMASAGASNRVFSEPTVVGMSFGNGAKPSYITAQNDLATVVGGDGELAITSAGAVFNTTVSGSDPVAASDFVTKSYLDSNTNTNFVGLIGDATASTFAVTHGLGNQYVQFSVWEVSTNDSIECDVVFTDADNMQFTFTNYVPSVDGVRVVING